MIVARWTFNVKQGAWNDLRALFKAERERHGSGFDRIYTCQLGARGRIAVEEEFEDLADMQKKEAEWSPPPEFVKQFIALTERGTTKEIWDVE